MKKRRVVISGGGTGGHIFPAIAIGEWIKARWPDADVQFVGAQGGMEMKRIPENGFPIAGLWISGLQRGFSAGALKKNLLLPLKIMVACWQAIRILKSQKPQVVIGVGGYASLPVVAIAQCLKIPTILAEQNAFPGLANRLLARKARAIWLGNERAARHFSSHTNVHYTGNPVRTNISLLPREDACRYFSLDLQKPVVLIFGGSLGAGTFNRILLKNYKTLLSSNIQVIWQTGANNFEAVKKYVPEQEGLVIVPFIQNMAAAYSAARLIVARAGAMTLSELIVLQKVAILVPSPNVTDDHQTHNAKSITEKGAGWLVSDSEADDKLVPLILDCFSETSKLAHASDAITSITLPDSQKIITEQLAPYFV